MNGDQPRLVTSFPSCPGAISIRKYIFTLELSKSPFRSFSPGCAPSKQYKCVYLWPASACLPAKNNTDLVYIVVRVSGPNTMFPLFRPPLNNTKTPGIHSSLLLQDNRPTNRWMAIEDAVEIMLGDGWSFCFEYTRRVIEKTSARRRGRE